MNNTIIENYNFTRNISKHGIVLGIFLVLTIILTFPVILDFTSEAAGQGCWDKCHMMWRMWWAGFSFENNLDFYYSQYIFQPNGVSIGGNLALFTTGIGAILQSTLGSTLAWNIIWISGFVSGGYGSFLLANHFTKNFYASIIAGVIFTFSSYHLVHSQFHIGLGIIVWLPLFILVLFKILEEKSKVLIVLGSMFLFLGAITHLYFFVILIIFSIVFFSIYIFKQKNVPNKTFMLNFFLILGIGASASLVVLTPGFDSISQWEEVSIREHLMYSTSLGALVTPTVHHTSQIQTDYGFWIWMHESLIDNEAETVPESIESYSYLGFPAIFLSIIALKFRFRFTWFWIFVGTGFAILSLGPELRIFSNLTGIWMPERFLFDFVPGWDEMRSSGRFIIMTHLSLAILSAFTINGIMKSKMFSKKVLILILIGIFSVLLFDVSASPFPSFTEEIPEIYDEIKNDKSEFVILEMPIGSDQTGSQSSVPIIGYYQTFHEKPIIGGHESRPTLDELAQTDTYFLKNFQRFENDVDIVKQDLSKYGIPILNYYDIKYAILHKDSPITLTDSSTKRVSIGEDAINNKSNIMSKILNSDELYFDDSKVRAWKIPESSNLEPFILLGEGWSWFDPKINARPMFSESEIKIINPNDSKDEISIMLELVSHEQNRNVDIFFNDERLNAYDINSVSITNIELENLVLIPGENIISIKADSSDKAKYYKNHSRGSDHISLFCTGISEKQI
ncbi:hypothetical protein OAJ50_00375 [Candidatus Nitrosopelagicus sp.]|nr:hypothetical protein [Candidatus Nitrosopelagicus sp.]